MADSPYPNDGAQAVLEIGPRTIRVVSGGAGARLPDALVAAALEWIDDPVGLFKGAPVAVADLWREVLLAAVGPHTDSLVVVHPPGCPELRIARVLAAANTVADRVVAVRSGEWVPSRPEPEHPQLEPVGRRRRRWPMAIAVAGSSCSRRRPAVAPPATACGSPASPVASSSVAVRIPGSGPSRITAGPVAPRVSLPFTDVALHITQSYAPEATPEQTAEVLAVCHRP